MTVPRKKPVVERIDPVAHEKLLMRIESDLRKSISIPRSMWRSFLAGVMSASGALVVVAIVIPFVLVFLQSIQWPPLVAQFVTQVIFQIEQAGRRPLPVSDGQ
ncbi:MAG: hypothetical protein KBD00_04075 [Candidatus Peribacteraceae bacterium]|nr:hypothetical protein [Candidatus Peribacteraceae bacterium]